MFNVLRVVFWLVVGVLVLCVLVVAYWFAVFFDDFLGWLNDWIDRVLSGVL